MKKFSQYLNEVGVPGGVNFEVGEVVKLLHSDARSPLGVIVAKGQLETTQGYSYLELHYEHRGDEIAFEYAAKELAPLNPQEKTTISHIIGRIRR